jgi:hypothetical protein
MDNLSKSADYMVKTGKYKSPTSFKKAESASKALTAKLPCKNCGKKGCNCSRKTLEKDTRNY